MFSAERMSLMLTAFQIIAALLLVLIPLLFAYLLYLRRKISKSTALLPAEKQKLLKEHNKKLYTLLFLFLLSALCLWMLLGI